MGNKELLVFLPYFCKREWVNKPLARLQAQGILDVYSAMNHLAQSPYPQISMLKTSNLSLSAFKPILLSSECTG